MNQPVLSWASKDLLLQCGSSWLTMTDKLDPARRPLLRLRGDELAFFVDAARRCLEPGNLNQLFRITPGQGELHIFRTYSAVTVSTAEHARRIDWQTLGDLLAWLDVTATYSDGRERVVPVPGAGVSLLFSGQGERAHTLAPPEAEELADYLLRAAATPHSGDEPASGSALGQLRLEPYSGHAYLLRKGGKKILLWRTSMVRLAARIKEGA